MNPLTEDNIDDILYCARANEPTELSSLLSSLCSQHSCSQAAILLSAVDSVSGNTVIHYAAANGHDAILTLFANAVSEAAPNISSPEWASPAHLTQLPSTFFTSSATSSATNGSTTNTPSSPSSYLVNVQNASNNTPLHWAALNGHLLCVQKLVALGADPRILNSAGHDAVFEAVRGDKAEVADWLLEKCGELEEGIGGAGMEEEEKAGGEEGLVKEIGKGGAGQEGGGSGLELEEEVGEGVAVNGAVGSDGVNGDIGGEGEGSGLGG